jgi:hypothetical protein
VTQNGTRETGQFNVVVVLGITTEYDEEIKAVEL